VKFFVIYILPFFISLFLYAQKETNITFYINNSLHRKIKTLDDSIHIQESLNKFSYKYYNYIVFDSLTKINNEYFCYYSLLPKNINLLITDENKTIENIKIKAKFIKNRFDYVLKTYENKGFPFAELILDTLYLKDNTLQANYLINKNNFIIYDSIDVIGKLVVSKKFLQSYLNINYGRMYKEKDVKNVDKLLQMLPFYKLNRPSEVYFINNKAKTRIFLEKNNANQFYGLIGFTNLNNKVGLNGEFNVSFYNLLHHSDMWQVKWKKNDIYSQNLYSEGNLPYIFSNPFGISGIFSLIKQDTSYLNLNYKIGFNIYIQGFNGLSMFFQRKETNVFYQNILNVAPIKANYAGISFYYKNLNNFYLPDKGHSIQLSVSYGQKNLKSVNYNSDLLNSIQKENNILTLTLYAYKFITLFDWAFVKLSIDAGYINYAHFKNELFRNGGSNSIRGFDEESIFSKQFIITSVEQRFKLDKNFQAFIFSDKMYYSSLNNISDDPYSIGIGTEINTNTGIFYISYAVGTQFNQPLFIRNAKLHFGYRNRF
jgi:hypothetical protein